VVEESEPMTGAENLVDAGHRLRISPDHLRAAGRRARPAGDRAVLGATFRDLIDARVALEPMLAGRAAAQPGPEAGSRLQEALEAARQFNKSDDLNYARTPSGSATFGDLSNIAYGSSKAAIVSTRPGFDLRRS
jgi:hypothetical protein